MVYFVTSGLSGRSFYNYALKKHLLYFSDIIDNICVCVYSELNLKKNKFHKISSEMNDTFTNIISLNLYKRFYISESFNFNILNINVIYKISSNNINIKITKTYECYKKVYQCSRTVKNHYSIDFIIYYNLFYLIVYRLNLFR